ncbi:MAG: hypothetical protein M3362_17870 [Acidobacteriota bacterium]|nr:hypothetical protein [Acidobacteriota bacterium]
MSIFVSRWVGKVLLGATLALALFGVACQPASNTANTSNSTTNVNVSNTSNTSSANNSATVPTSSFIETKEPDQYSATITMKLEVTGNQSATTPPLSADFAKSGPNQRVSFKLGNDQVIYLDRADKRYIILPNRKQYAEIDQQSTGFDVPKMMTPAQIVSQVKNVQGCTNAGEEQFGGRAAIKYSCAAATKTGTQAGDVNAQSFVYVDKDTGLPLHSESVVTSSGNVGGASSVRIVTEMSNIQTSVPSTTFDEPAGMSKIDPNQVRSQVDMILKTAAIFAQNMMQNSGSTGGAPSPSPSASATPQQ